MLHRLCPHLISTSSGEQWRALTRIKVRKEPSIKAPQLEDKVIEKGGVTPVSRVAELAELGAPVVF